MERANRPTISDRRDIASLPNHGVPAGSGSSNSNIQENMEIPGIPHPDNFALGHHAVPPLPAEVEEDVAEISIDSEAEIEF